MTKSLLFLDNKESLALLKRSAMEEELLRTWLIVSVENTAQQALPFLVLALLVNTVPTTSPWVS